MKFERRVDELLLKVGSGAYWKDTTLYKTFNPVQRKKLFDLYITKTHWTDSCQVANDDNGNKFFKRDPNVYVWKDQEAMSARYNKLVSEINPHAPMLGRKPIADAPIQSTNATEQLGSCHRKSTRTETLLRCQHNDRSRPQG